MTPKQHTVLRIVAVTTGFVVATPFMLSAALMSEPQPGAESPARIVLELDQRALRGDWSAAHRLFSYERKGSVVLPELWKAANDDDRAAFIEFWKPQFEKGWNRTRGGDLRDKTWRIDETWLSDERVLVQQRVDSGERDLVLCYWLEQAASGWRIVDRTYLIDGLEHSGTPMIRMVLRKVTAQIGRSPTLREFVANAPSWVGRMRAKNYRLR